jgi:hypothetical protein
MVHDPTNIKTPTLSRNTVVGIATSYRLDDRGGRSSSSDRLKNFSLLHVVQTGSAINPTSYPMGTGGSFPAGKAAGV